MKTKAELEKDIINITMKIREKFPELSKYISEMPEIFSGKAYNPTGIKHFKEYYNSLEEVLVEYAKTHVAKKNTTIKNISKMKIQFNTDKTIKGDERNQDFLTDLIAQELDRYQSHISRIEVHISDQNGNKEGLNDIQCLLEARLEGRQPIAVSAQADTIEIAVSGAIDKLQAALETILGRIQDH